MYIEFKSNPNEGECSVVDCKRSKAGGYRMVYHHTYETNAHEREVYKSRVKTPISRLKESENPNVQERNSEERSLCKLVCVHHHSVLHANEGNEQTARATADLAGRVRMGLHMACTNAAKQLSEEEIKRMEKQLRRRLAQLDN
jgi:hypothetical protein